MSATSSPQSSQQSPSRSRGIGRRASVAAALVAAGSLALGGVALAHDGNNGGGPGRSLAGTVVSVASPSFSLQGRGSKTTSVLTTSGTTFVETADADVSDADPGEVVDVHGVRTDADTVDARRIAVAPAPVGTAKPGRHHGGHVVGTVVSNDTGTIVVKVGDGTVTVTTGADTKVIETTVAAFADVKAGERVRASGDRTGDNAIVANRVHIDLTVHPVRPAPTTTSTSSTSTTSTTSPAIQNAALASAKADDDGTADQGQGDAATTSTTAKPVGAKTEDRANARGGKIASITTSAFVVTQRDGSSLVVHTTPDTAYVNAAGGNTRPAAFSDLAVGDKVEVVGPLAADGTVTATRVVFGMDRADNGTVEDHHEAESGHGADDATRPSGTDDSHRVDDSHRGSDSRSSSGSSHR